ncbi:MAG: HAMP domain-containing histidine kinase [Candidatus Gastranaerophilales bacterium]|nr:HAMP domain-containing histidine kinase [Candidatus Gastranaerophilales bacterium]
MLNKFDLYNNVKKILKEVRFGNLSNRLSLDKYTDDTDFINDFNNMLEALDDRENMIKEYQNTMQANNEYLKALFNMLNEGAMTLSEDLKILTINTTLVKWLRKSKTNLIGQYLPDILKKYSVCNLQNKIIKLDYSEIFESDKKNLILVFNIKKISLTVSISIKKFLDKDKKTNYFIIAKDITSDIQLQKLKNTFVATLTHDLKVPIIAEEKVLNLLLQEAFGTLQPLQKEALNNMLINNNDMMSLVTTILDVYKLEDGVFKINPVKTDISEILMSEIDKIKYIADENSTKFITNNTTPNTENFVDVNEISRVFKNLLTNAIEFAPQNTNIEINIYKQQNYLCIDIKDFGKEIPKENIPYIFERYFTTEKKYRKVGTGLGLYLSKKIIELHNGEIKVESSKKNGTTFTVKLPLK